MTLRSKQILGGLGVLATAAILTATLGAAAAAPEDQDKKSDPAVERARQQVKMLDSLYKTAVVSITDRYKKGQPAIMVAKDVFKAMEDAGFHSAKLVDASGAPLGEESEPKTDFEKKAAEAMQNGETYIDEVVGEGDDRRLLAATVVPAVLDRCASCHGAKKGDLLGFIRYDVPIR